MSEEGALPVDFRLSSFPEPGDRYVLGNLLGSGAYSEVFEATDQQSGGRRVAIKIHTMTPGTEEDIRNEYNILREHSSHPNLPHFYAVFLKKASTQTECDKIWFVIELCEGGPVTDLVRGLQNKNRRMSEEQIAYILKEIIKVLVHLHENRVMHRDVKGSNILLTKDGEVKLVDFGLSRLLKNPMDKRGTYVGSPCWMAPEIVTSSYKEEDKVYDSRVDVWALGITAIELGDGKAPFQDIHPTRALFQIVRNPPPSLYRPANWSQVYNDFVSECLEKNPEHRPFIMELLEHPFITGLPENDFHLSTELKILIADFASEGKLSRRTEVAVRNGFLKTGLSPNTEVMHPEDLAAMDMLNEDVVLEELHERLKQGNCHTFVGDVLLVLNPNEQQSIYDDKFHAKYQFKARSDNAPHIYSVADRAYQDVLHHEEPQYILLAGETLSGKTTNLLHLLRHLLFLGQSPSKIGDNVEKATNVIHALGNAATPSNPNSTRHVLQLELTFTSTGKVSGAIFWLYLLEKWRVTTTHKGQANFHIFYYFYDAMEASGRLEQYNLGGGRAYRYLRTQLEEGSNENSFGVREDPEGNVEKFRILEQQMRDLGFLDDQLETFCNFIAAILILGEVRFKQGDDKEADLENPETAAKVAQLLSVDDKKFCWALVNYCSVQKGTAVRRRHTQEEAQEARDVLARGLYFRLVDWITNVINHKLAFTRAVFGDKYSITLMDLFGFECFKKNDMEQLFVNTLNEQLQYHYNQRVFVWEMQEQEEEEIPVQPLQYFDNRSTVDELMTKPDGLFYLLDEASRTNQGSGFILGSIENTEKSSHLKVLGNNEFSIAHYTGKVTYNCRDMSDKNRDFLPPEMVDTLRLSTDKMVKLMFTNQLSRTGNLTMSAEECGVIVKSKKNRWGAALVADNESKIRGQFSQTRQMRTAATTYRSTSLEILRSLAVGPGSGGTHFVRCIRSDLTEQPRGFQSEVVRQQLRALAVLDTAHARQKGYPHRIPFPEFIRRYKFLAFDFDETVDVTKDNSRLLLVRLKMEGWVIGKSKVFLKYYNEEYLARSYEIQVKKIIKVQTMMRAFLAKRNVASKLLKFRKLTGDRDKDDKNKQQNSSCELTEESASLIIQKQFRGYRVRKELGPQAKRKLDVNTVEFIREYWRRWKTRTIFQVLLMYRAARQQDLIYFSQQVHLYNQTIMSALDKGNREYLSLDNVECGARASLVLGKRRPTVWKLPFRLDQDLPYFDTTYLSDPITSGVSLYNEDDQEAWDAPLRRTSFVSWKTKTHATKDKEVQTGMSLCQEDQEEDHFIQTPFSRDPKEVETRKQISKQDQQRKCNIQNNVSPQKVCQVQSPTQLHEHSKSKKPEVYNPGKARRLEQRQEIDNQSREWENSNIQDLVPKYNQRNTAPPIPQQISKTSFDNVDNRNTNNMEMTSRRHQGDYKWEPISPYHNEKPSKNLKNEYNRQEPARSTQYAKRYGGSQFSNNPIAEMEMKGKRSCHTEEIDEPPFNFQAMLRKTNTNRASLRRTSCNIPETTSKETFTHQHNKNTSTNDESNSRSSSIVYNSSNRSKHASPTPSLSKSDSKKSWNEKEQWSKGDLKNSWNEAEQWNKYDSKKPWNENEQEDRSNSSKSWNDSENGSDSKKSWIENEQWAKSEREIEPQDRPDSQKLWNDNEQQETSSFIKPWNENEQRSPDSMKSDSVKSWNKSEQNIKKTWNKNELYRSDSMKSQKGNEQYIRSDPKKSLKQNEQYGIPDSKKVLPDNERSLNTENKHHSTTETKTPCTQERGKTTTTELVPGLIIEGEIADL